MTQLYEAFFGKRRTIIKYQLANNSMYVFEIDCTMSENHNIKNAVTSHEVEKGSNISDNIRQEMDTVNLSGIISDFPLSPFAITGFTSTSEEDKPSRKAYEVFKEIAKSGYICTLETTLGDYENMVITDVSFPRDKGTINTLVFNCTFQQIITVDSEVTTISKGNVKEDVKKKAPEKKNIGETKPTAPTGKKDKDIRTPLAKYDDWLQGR